MSPFVWVVSHFKWGRLQVNRSLVLQLTEGLIPWWVWSLSDKDRTQQIHIDTELTPKNRHRTYFTIFTNLLTQNLWTLPWLLDVLPLTGLFGGDFDRFSRILISSARPLAWPFPGGRRKTVSKRQVPAYRRLDPYFREYIWFLNNLAWKPRGGSQSRVLGHQGPSSCFDSFVRSISLRRNRTVIIMMIWLAWSLPRFWAGVQSIYTYYILLHPTSTNSRELIFF